MIVPGFGEIAERLRRATVLVKSEGRRAGAGSGIVWSAGGLIVTNSHVALSANSTVELWDGREFPATLSARDARRDLALLEVKAGGLEPATPADSGKVRPGELVVAIGNPLGFVGALSTGVVHAVGPFRGLGPREWIQADVRLLPGNSGGPLADARGRIIGINTMIAGGLALAAPSNSVDALLRRRGTGVGLGVTVQPVRARGGALGLLVIDVMSGSPAADASLLAGDLLVGAQGRRFESADDLARAIEDAAGGLLRLEFLRGERRAQREVAVRLGARMAEAA